MFSKIEISKITNAPVNPFTRDSIVNAEKFVLCLAAPECS